MSLHSLYTAIRKEDVALWIGAGFSLYAGYPSGKKIQEIIFKSLSPDEQSQLGSNASLKQTASALVTFRNGSRNALNQIIRDEFGKMPTDRYLHDLLSRIPHIKDIVTTNYDSMIETSYLGRADVIRSSKDIPYINSSRPAIFKPHGDLESLDRIVITENDYASFYNINKADPMWTAILGLIAKKTQVFLAYGFEDDNIWSWFDLIDKSVGEHRKERFLIAPNWSPLYIKKLEARHIEYIDMTADQFLTELNVYLKEHIAGDLESGMVSQETYNAYTSFHDIESSISLVEGKPQITEFHRKGNGKTMNDINFTINDPLIAKQILHLQKGYNGAIKIGPDKLEHFEHVIEGFKMGISKETIASFHIISLPAKHRCSIEVPDKDISLDDVEFEFKHIEKNRYEVKAEYWGFGIFAKITYKKKNRGYETVIKFTAPEKLPSVIKCVTIQKLIVAYLEGHKVIINRAGVTTTIPGSTTKMDITPHVSLLTFFENLRQIEKQFNVRFEGADASYTKENFKLAKKLVELIENKYLPVQFPNGLVCRHRNNNQPITLPDKMESLLLKSDEYDHVELLQRKIELGEGGMQIMNFEVVKYSENGMQVMVKSTTNDYRQRFSSLFDFNVDIIGG
ncbi:SIR2 family NAD-dependent protein deacylase [Mucilaginibacter sp. SJ]|uniref:SIR2 family NAD-dependent protein deacylase n=1 Tax=Mucilaginibacter sp. SJ TaxID=3029053 RepID=UPI0023AA0143|nr:SIR2 family protein [Mucilaginibacter sp. SJ]WEA00736.1 SIR2 family protein [Mucilaginibacter sp. SJ]